MAKYAPDTTLDKILDYVALADLMVVCTGSPTTYAEVQSSGSKLASVLMASGSFLKADDTSGRKVTMTAATGVPIVLSGDALAVALVHTGSSTLHYVTTCTQQALVNGGTVDIPAWKINIQDPT